MDVIVVSADTPEELEQVKSLFEQYRRSEGGPDLEDDGIAFEIAGLPGAYAPPGGRLLLAREGAGPVGCVALRPLGNGRGEIKRMFVPTIHRGRGIGPALLSALIIEARAMRLERLVLDTLPHMASAQALYRQWGFTETPPYHDKFGGRARFFERLL